MINHQKLAWMLTLAIPGSEIQAQESQQESPGPPTHMATEQNLATADGSLWYDTGYQNFVQLNRTAKQPGDLVTVRIVEASQATKSATTSVDRDSSIEAGVGALFGLEGKVIEKAPIINPSSLLSANAGSAFAGKGTTTRSGTLTATVTAQVVQVLPNGNLVILGRQAVKINNELQILTLRGIIRPQDIQVNNTINSTHIADARIEFTGEGDVAAKQRPGWLLRGAEKVWPF